MDRSLKQRMIGAVVLIALAVIFIPMLLDGGSEEGTEIVSRDIPLPPEGEFRSRLMPLDGAGAKPEPAGEGATLEPPAQAEPAPTQTAPVEKEPEAAGVPETEQAETEPRVPSPESQVPHSEPRPEQQAAETRSPDPLANWFVQVGSFAEQANAMELRDRLRAADYTAFVEDVSVGGEQTHRVMVGPQMDESLAEEVRDDIQAEFGLNGIVVEQP